LAHVLYPRLPHLLGQPLPPIQTYLNADGKPGLNASVHPTQLRIDSVMVEM
jgi:hypothetical protein